MRDIMTRIIEFIIITTFVLLASSIDSIADIIFGGLGI